MCQTRPAKVEGSSAPRGMVRVLPMGKGASCLLCGTCTGTRRPSQVALSRWPQRGFQMSPATKRLFAPTVIFVLLAAAIATGGLVLSGVVLAQQSNVSPVTNITVCSGPNAGEVIVSWDAIPSATYYRIGYVNMVKDYPRAKASATGEWIEAFIYVDVNAQNIPSTGGREQYTLRRLVQGDRHAFTVLTSNSVVNTRETISGAYSWPQNPRWAFHEVANPQPDCTAAAPPHRQTNTNPNYSSGNTDTHAVSHSDADAHTRIQCSQYRNHQVCFRPSVLQFLERDHNPRQPSRCTNCPRCGGLWVAQRTKFTRNPRSPNAGSPQYGL